MAVTNVHSFGGTLLLDYCMLLWICPCVFILLNFNVFIMCRCCLRQQWIWEKDWLTLAPQILILCLWYSLTSNSHLVISSLCQDKRKTIAFVWCACLMNIATDAQGCLNFLYPVEQCSWLHGQCITCSQELSFSFVHWSFWGWGGQVVKITHLCSLWLAVMYYKSCYLFTKTSITTNVALTFITSVDIWNKPVCWFLKIRRKNVKNQANV